MDLRLVGRDERFQEAIRRKLAGGGRETPARASQPARTAPADTMKTLSDQRRKLLGLYYEDRISMDLSQEEEERLALAIEAVRNQASTEVAQRIARSELEVHFGQVAAVLKDFDIERVWEAADSEERRVLIEELVGWVIVFPDHLEVTVVGTPPLAVRYGEVGLKESEIVGVGGAFRPASTPPLLRGEVLLRAA